MTRSIAAVFCLGLLAACATTGGSQPALPALSAAEARPIALAAYQRYVEAGKRTALDLRTVVGGAAMGVFNDRLLRESLSALVGEWAAVSQELARAARAPDFNLELCIACQEVDWDGNGVIQDGERALLEVERDEKGEPYPDNDPRRRPTFRFDHGDLLWGQAMLSFQSAFLELLLALDWTPLKIAVAQRQTPDSFVLSYVEPQRLASAKRSILAGLDSAAASRADYLAETDDDREWLPNPRQKDHPMPMPVDDALYATWADVLADVKKLVSGQEGLSLREIAELEDNTHAGDWSGFIDLSVLFVPAPPRTIQLEGHGGSSMEMLKSWLGPALVASKPASGLPARLKRMSGEINRGEEALSRKLRYLLWLN